MIVLLNLRQAIQIASEHIKQHPDQTALVVNIEDEKPVAEFTRRSPAELDTEKLVAAILEQCDYTEDEAGEPQWSAQALVPLNLESN